MKKENVTKIGNLSIWVLHEFNAKAGREDI
jgi:hypothetical protein